MTLEEILSGDFDDKFKNYINERTIAEITGLISFLESSYNTLVNLRDSIMTNVLENPDKSDEDKKEGVDLLKEVYIRLTILENQIVYMKERKRELFDVG